MLPNVAKLKLESIRKPSSRESVNTGVLMAHNVVENECPICMLPIRQTRNWKYDPEILLTTVPARYDDEEIAAGLSLDTWLNINCGHVVHFSCQARHVQGRGEWHWRCCSEYYSTDKKKETITNMLERSAIEKRIRDGYNTNGETTRKQEILKYLTDLRATQDQQSAAERAQADRDNDAIRRGSIEAEVLRHALEEADAQIFNREQQDLNAQKFLNEECMMQIIYATLTLDMQLMHRQMEHINSGIVVVDPFFARPGDKKTVLHALFTPSYARHNERVSVAEQAEVAVFVISLFDSALSETKNKRERNVARNALNDARDAEHFTILCLASKLCEKAMCESGRAEVNEMPTLDHRIHEMVIRWLVQDVGVNKSVLSPKAPNNSNKKKKNHKGKKAIDYAEESGFPDSITDLLRITGGALTPAAAAMGDPVLNDISEAQAVAEDLSQAVVAAITDPAPPDEEYTVVAMNEQGQKVEIQAEDLKNVDGVWRYVPKEVKAPKETANTVTADSHRVSEWFKHVQTHYYITDGDTERARKTIAQFVLSMNGKDITFTSPEFLRFVQFYTTSGYENWYPKTLARMEKDIVFVRKDMLPMRYTSNPPGESDEELNKSVVNDWATRVLTRSNNTENDKFRAGMRTKGGNGGEWLADSYQNKQSTTAEFWSEDELVTHVRSWWDTQIDEVETELVKEGKLTPIPENSAMTHSQQKQMWSSWTDQMLNMSNTNKELFHLTYQPDVWVFKDLEGIKMAKHAIHMQRAENGYKPMTPADYAVVEKKLTEYGVLMTSEEKMKEVFEEIQEIQTRLVELRGAVVTMFSKSSQYDLLDSEHSESLWQLDANIKSIYMNTTPALLMKLERLKKYVVSFYPNLATELGSSSNQQRNEASGGSSSNQQRHEASGGSSSSKPSNIDRVLAFEPSNFVILAIDMDTNMVTFKDANGRRHSVKDDTLDPMELSELGNFMKSQYEALVQKRGEATGKATGKVNKEYLPGMATVGGTANEPMHVFFRHMLSSRSPPQQLSGPTAEIYKISYAEKLPNIDLPANLNATTTPAEVIDWLYRRAIQVQNEFKRINVDTSVVGINIWYGIQYWLSFILKKVSDESPVAIRQFWVGELTQAEQHEAQKTLTIDEYLHTIDTIKNGEEALRQIFINNSHIDANRFRYISYDGSN